MTTNKRGFKWVIIQDFSRRRGPYCDVSVYASMGNTSGLKLKIHQAVLAPHEGLGVTQSVPSSGPARP